MFKKRTRGQGLAVPLVLTCTLFSAIGTPRASAGDYSIDIYFSQKGDDNVADSWFRDINEHGQVAGYAIYDSFSGPATPIIYQNGTVTKLDGSGSVYAINNQGDAYVYDGHAFYFYAADGSVIPIEAPEGYILDIDAIRFFDQMNDGGNVLFDANDPFDLSFGLDIWNRTGTTQMLSALEPLYQQLDNFTKHATGLNNANQFAASVWDVQFGGGVFTQLFHRPTSTTVEAITTYCSHRPPIRKSGRSA